jgi:hypothetical protein
METNAIRQEYGKPLISFRAYRAGDHNDVWSVFADCTHQLGFRLGPWNDDVHTIPSVYIEPGGDFIVGEHGGRIVAFAGLYRNSPKRWQRLI